MALAAGVDLEPVADALADAAPGLAAGGWSCTSAPTGCVVVNDAYNANPASMRAALEALAAIGGRRGRRTVAVLGEMLELGDGAAAAHRERRRRTPPRAGVDVLVAVGRGRRGDRRRRRRRRGWAGAAIATAGRDEALAWVRENVAAGDVVLVKASRGAALETIADGLLDRETEEGAPR